MREGHEVGGSGGSGVQGKDVLGYPYDLENTDGGRRRVVREEAVSQRGARIREIRSPQERKEHSVLIF